jgi:branched-chain amino acid transport system substrate-binding protein
MNTKWKIFVVSILVLALIVVAILVGKKASEEIKIGAILPLTGQSAKYGQWIQDALEMARKKINAAHDGVNGKKLTIIYEDDQALPQYAVSAIRKLISTDKVPIVFGSWASSCVLAEAPIAEEAHIPVLAEAQSPKIRDAGDYIFRIQPDSRFYLKVLVPYVRQNLGIKSLVILFVNNDYGSDQAQVFKESFEQLGGRVVLYEGFAQNTIDFRSVLAKIKSLHPDGVFVPAYTEAGYVLRQAAEIGLKTHFIGSAPMENPDIVTIAGEGAEGAIYPHHFDPESDDPMVKTFLEEYKLQYGRQAEGYAALAYDALFIIASILRRCGENPDCIKKELYGTQKFPGVTGLTSFDDHGDVIKPIVIRTIRRGRFVTIWRESNLAY